MEEFDIGRFIPLILIGLYFLLQFFSSARKANNKTQQKPKQKPKSLLGQLLEDIQQSIEPPAPSVSPEEVPHWTIPSDSTENRRSKLDTHSAGSIDESKSFFKEAAFQDHDFFKSGDAFGTRRPRATPKPAEAKATIQIPLVTRLSDNESVREAVILSEILGKPRSLRRQ